MVALAGAVERQGEVVRFLAYPARSTAHRGISGGICRGNVKAVQRMLGHAKASMTLDVYADLFDEDLDGDRLDAAILVAGHRSDLRLRSRGGGIRTHDLFVQNDPHLRVWEVTEVE